MATRFPAAALVMAAALALSAVLATPSWAAPIPWPPLVAGGPASADGAHDRAVIVAIERYDKLYEVHGATLNAEEWRSWLVHSRGLAPSSVQLLLDEDATRESILGAVERAKEEVGSGGTLWFVFIGHGDTVPGASGGQTGMILGADARPTTESIRSRGVSHREIESAWSFLEARAIILFDACFSGDSAAGPLRPNLMNPGRPRDAPSDWVTRLSAGTDSQYAGLLPGLGRPAFSYLVLGGLQGWADADGNGEVTVREAVGYAREALAVTLTDREQTPTVSGPHADDVLALATAPGPELVAADPHDIPEVFITFDSVPASAEVSLDGRPLCPATPCTRYVPMGVYEVAWQLPGHVAARRTVSLYGDRTVSSELTTLIATLEITTADDQPLKILVNGVPHRAPVTLDVAPGPVRIEVRDDPGFPATERVLESGTVEAIHLAPDSDTGVLAVDVVDWSGNDVRAELTFSCDAEPTSRREWEVPEGPCKVSAHGRGRQVRVTAHETRKVRLVVGERPKSRKTMMWTGVALTGVGAVLAPTSALLYDPRTEEPGPIGSTLAATEILGYALAGTGAVLTAVSFIPGHAVTVTIAPHGMVASLRF